MSELAVFLRSKEGIIEIERALSSLFSRRKTVRGDGIIKALSFLEGVAAKSIIYLLLKKRILNTVESHEEIEFYIFSLNQNALKKYIKYELNSLKIVKEIEPMLFSGKEKEFELLVTYPNDKKFTKVEGFSLLYPALKKIIMDAKKNLWIVNPFFDPFGTLQILDDLVNAAKRGVQIRIVTRGAAVEGNKRLSKSLEYVFKRFKKENLLNMLEVRDYFKKSKETMQQIFAVHSKILIADKIICYLGSANITSTCLYSNLETGVVLKGKNIEPLVKLFATLWEVSSRTIV